MALALDGRLIYVQASSGPCASFSGGQSAGFDRVFDEIARHVKGEAVPVDPATGKTPGGLNFNAPQFYEWPIDIAALPVLYDGVHGPSTPPSREISQFARTGVAPPNWPYRDTRPKPEPKPTPAEATEASSEVPAAGGAGAVAAEAAAAAAPAAPACSKE